MRQLKDTGPPGVLALLTAALTGAGALVLVAACGSPSPRLSSAGASSTPPPSASSAATPSAQPRVSDVLDSDGIGQTRFGEAPRTVNRQLDTLLGQPTKRYYPASACNIDHATEWPGLIVFFFRSQFVGYTYGLPPTGQLVLATTQGLRIGDTLSYGQRLYGQAFHMGIQQGGVWWATTAHGQIEGFTNGPQQNGTDVGPRSVVRTIEAGKVGCPAMTP